MRNESKNVFTQCFVNMTIKFVKDHNNELLNTLRIGYNICTQDLLLKIHSSIFDNSVTHIKFNKNNKTFECNVDNFVNSMSNQKSNTQIVIKPSMSSSLYSFFYFILLPHIMQNILPIM